MANEVSGINGAVTFTGAQANAFGWSLTYEAVMLDATTFADAGVRRFKSGPTGWSGQINLHWSDDNTKVVGTSASLTLQATTGETFTGTAIFSVEEDNTQFDDLVGSVFSFQGTGALTKPT